MRVDIWSDLVCPWCYLGKRRFEKALSIVSPGAPVDVVHRSFQLDPTVPKGQSLRARDMLMRKYRMSEAEVVAAQEHLERLAAAEGLEYHLAESHTGNTMDAHRLVHLGRDQGIEDAVIERLYRAHFTENRSIFDDDSLQTLGTEAGLTGIAELLGGRHHEEAVIADHREAHQRGVRGVPFFLIDGRLSISGAQSIEIFVETLAHASKGLQTHHS